MYRANSLFRQTRNVGFKDHVLNNGEKNWKSQQTWDGATYRAVVADVIRTCIM